MNNSVKYGVIILLLIGAGFALHFMNEASEPERMDRNVELIDWKRTYDSQSNHPYGTYLLHELLENGWSHNGFQSLNTPLETYFAHDSLQIKTKAVNYVFIGSQLKLHNEEVDSLLEFVRKGGNAFIAAELFPAKLLNSLMSYDYGHYMDQMSDSLLNLKFYQDGLADYDYEIAHEIDHKKVEREWKVWAFNMRSDYSKISLGSAEDNDCFIKLYCGNGKIFLHTIPQTFTNNYLKTAEGRQYVETALSYLPKGVILWDDYTPYIQENSSYEMDNNDFEGATRTGNKVNTKSIISFLMKSPPLKWAYLIIVAGMIIFVVFMGKRRQKVIPTVLPNLNTSLEFTQTISRIYLHQNQHNKLIKHMETIFRDKIKSKYYIQYTNDESYAERIAKKSGVAEKEVKHLLELFKAGVNIQEVSDDFLINLYTTIQDFYKKAK